MAKLKSVLFISRNKDNKGLEGFKQRSEAFLVHDGPEAALEIWNRFNRFGSEGVKGEFSRYYISVNDRDEEKVKKAVLIKMIDRENFDLTKLDKLAASIADRKENALTSKWLFDYDSKDFFGDFLKALYTLGGFSAKEVQTNPTPHGYVAVVAHGFDTRKLLEDFPCATLKRDDKLYVDCYQN